MMRLPYEKEGTTETSGRQLSVGKVKFSEIATGFYRTTFEVNSRDFANVDISVREVEFPSSRSKNYSIDVRGLNNLIEQIRSNAQFRQLFKEIAKKQGNSKLFAEAFESAQCKADENEHCKQKQRNCAKELVKMGVTLGVDGACILLAGCGGIGGVMAALGTVYQAWDTVEKCYDMMDYCNNQGADKNNDGVIETQVTVTIVDDSADLYPDFGLDCTDPFVDCWVIPFNGIDTL